MLDQQWSLRARGAGLVEAVVGGTSVPGDVPLGERGDCFPHRGRCAEPGQRRLGGLEALHADVPDDWVGGTVPRRPLPGAAAIPARPAASAGLVAEVAAARGARRVPEGFRGVIAACDAASSSSSAVTTAAGTIQPSPAWASMTRYSRWPRGRTGGNSVDRW